jgi:hypothetical protein
MSNHPLRSDTICQDCGETVERKFCPNCGQKNIETRQSFGYLLRHFIEDFTHYDSGFWLTIKYLLFRPGYLTKEYLRGRRTRFVAPVRLYIFISFITFFLPHILPDFGDSHLERHAGVLARDSAFIDKQIHFDFLEKAVDIPDPFRSVREMDSLNALRPLNQRMLAFDRWVAKKNILLHKYDRYELGEKFFDSFGHNVPKALFIYMPLFALLLWLFHGKKRWLYFDHAIFTLHYFSFILLFFNLVTISKKLLFFGEVAENVWYVLLCIVIVGIFIYFFVAHRRMYEESGVISFIKALLICSVNLLFFGGLSLLLALVSLYSIH